MSVIALTVASASLNSQIVNTVMSKKIFL